MAKWRILGAVLLVVAMVGAAFLLYMRQGGELLRPGGLIPSASVELPYARLSFSRLAQREITGGQIEIGEVIKEDEGYEAKKFFYYSEGKKISGQINLPVTVASTKMPVVVMARGYVAKDGYYTGLGTRNAASVYAKNGYITLAPDFLGYGESEMEDTDSIGARLYRPVEILDLLGAISSLPQADTNNVFLWGHSNGGQIMLSVAEILGLQELRGRTPKVRGMMLWAPVSKPFPFSILAFSDEADDQGKALRRAVAVFESRYDVFEYSIDRYFEKIEIPIILHQGIVDDAVPYWWSDSLNEKLEELGKDIDYHKYVGADHNLRPSWDNAVKSDVNFMLKIATN